MKAKSFLIQVVTMVFMVLSALHVLGDDTFQGEVLWWMVGDVEDDYHDLSGVTIKDFDGTVLPHNSDGSYTVRGMDINAARVRVVGTDQYLNLIADVEGSTVELMGETGEIPDYFFAVVVPYNSNEYSFMIELGNSDWSDEPSWVTLAVSEVASYETLKDQKAWITKWSDGPDPTQTGLYWAPASYTVPEPTGGLLFVIGGALLALRRRHGGV